MLIQSELLTPGSFKGVFSSMRPSLCIVSLKSPCISAFIDFPKNWNGASLGWEALSAVGHIVSAAHVPWWLHFLEKDFFSSFFFLFKQALIWNCHFMKCPLWYSLHYRYFVSREILNITNHLERLLKSPTVCLWAPYSKMIPSRG